MSFSLLPPPPPLWTVWAPTTHTKLLPEPNQRSKQTNEHPVIPYTGSFSSCSPLLHLCYHPYEPSGPGRVAPTLISRHRIRLEPRVERLPNAWATGNQFGRSGNFAIAMPRRGRPCLVVRLSTAAWIGNSRDRGTRSPSACSTH